MNNDTFVWRVLTKIMAKEKKNAYYPNMLHGMTSTEFVHAIVKDVLLMNTEHSEEHITDLVTVLCCMERAISEARVKSGRDVLQSHYVGYHPILPR